MVCITVYLAQPTRVLFEYNLSDCHFRVLLSMFSTPSLVHQKGLMTHHFPLLPGTYLETSVTRKQIPSPMSRRVNSARQTMNAIVFSDACISLTWLSPLNSKMKEPSTSTEFGMVHTHKFKYNNVLQ